MKALFLIISSLFLTSCIPTKIAPRIKEDKIVYAKKFKRKLQREYAFVFEDPKGAQEFYNYINIKYERGDKDVPYNTPIIIDSITYYLSFKEVERHTETINFVPMVIDAALENNGSQATLQDAYIMRLGTWYLLLTVRDDDLKDCLHPKYPKRNQIIKHLQAIRLEYLNTQNYIEAYLNKNNGNKLSIPSKTSVKEHP